MLSIPSSVVSVLNFLILELFLLEDDLDDLALLVFRGDPAYAPRFGSAFGLCISVLIYSFILTR